MRVTRLAVFTAFLSTALLILEMNPEAYHSGYDQQLSYSCSGSSYKFSMTAKIKLRHAKPGVGCRRRMDGRRVGHAMPLR
jgi:hypothetical protein